MVHRGAAAGDVWLRLGVLFFPAGLHGDQRVNSVTTQILKTTELKIRFTVVVFAGNLIFPRKYQSQTPKEAETDDVRYDKACDIQIFAHLLALRLEVFAAHYVDLETRKQGESTDSEERAKRNASFLKGKQAFTVGLTWII